ncbi:hypothetical protein QBC36DRAFT_312498 [Triangularia setosa]|uniref:Uncharacterized protein n=1 Tax=Triangularia setosa TaxID=2587417 RepID=A0AAN7A6B1_9PEZI|nr:hypothetical protein QBC36DRAFT_312498 [Podospora setosa]
MSPIGLSTPLPNPIISHHPTALVLSQPSSPFPPLSNLLSNNQASTPNRTAIPWNISATVHKRHRDGSAHINAPLINISPVSKLPEIDSAAHSRQRCPVNRSRRTVLAAVTNAVFDQGRDGGRRSGEGGGGGQCHEEENGGEDTGKSLSYIYSTFDDDDSPDTPVEQRERDRRGVASVHIDFWLVASQYWVQDLLTDNMLLRSFFALRMLIIRTEAEFKG